MHVLRRQIFAIYSEFFEKKKRLLRTRLIFERVLFSIIFFLSWTKYFDLWAWRQFLVDSKRSAWNRRPPWPRRIRNWFASAFNPRRHNSRPQARAAAISTTSGASRRAPKRYPWTPTFFCLADTTATKTPSAAEKQILFKADEPNNDDVRRASHQTSSFSAPPIVPQSSSAPPSLPQASSVAPPSLPWASSSSSAPPSEPQPGASSTPLGV